MSNNSNSAAVHGEISWDADVYGGQEKKQTNNKDLWLRLEDGSNVIRLVTQPFQYLVHKGIKKKGDKGFGQKVKCSKVHGSCPLCEMGLKAGPRWFLGVIDRKSNSYRVLDVSYQVFSQIRKLARKTEVWGDPTKYDIDICVDKNGGPTGYYSVQPIPHKPLSATDQQIRDTQVDLEFLKNQAMPLTLEQVQKRLEKILDGGTLEMPAAAPAKAKASGGKTASKAAPVVDLESDDDNLEDVFPDYNAEVSA